MFGRFETRTDHRSVASGPSLPALTTTRRLRGLLVARSTKIIHTWFALRLEHYGGKYSVERMLALEEYTRKTSMDRVLLVTIGAPLLVIFLVLCQESVSLQDPTDGWRANYGFWVRAGLVGVGVGNAASIQIGFWLDVPPFSMKQVVGYCTLMAVGYVTAGMLMARFWVFPIPFFMFTLCLVTTIVILVYIRLVVGARGFRQIMSRREQLRRLTRVGLVQALMYIVYPAYQVLFSTASHSAYEMPVLTILLIVRLVLKLMFISAAAQKEDMVPVQVVFTVDFFDAFYFASFIQSVSSLTLAAIMVFDLVQTAVELHELHQRTRRVLSQIHRIPDIELNHASSLLVATRALCNSVDTLDIQVLKTIQIRSCIYHPLSDEGRALLNKLERYSCSGSCTNSYQHNLKTLSRAAFVIPNADPVSKTDWRTCCSRMKVGAAPVASSPSPPSAPSPRKNDIMTGSFPINSSRKKSVVNTSVVLQEALEVLFTSECLALSEYMEVIVPTLYGIFVLAMVHLPSAQYHTELAAVNSNNVVDVVARIFAYTLMEFGSFIVLAVIKQKYCGINVLYQLAFVIETQTLFVQSTLMMWILMILTYRVVHFGCDFSFQFEWVRQSF